MNSDIEIGYNLIYNNMSSNIGGGISTSESEVNIFNNTIVNNTSIIGGGLHAFGGGGFFGYNNILWDNTSTSYPEYYGTVNLDYTACTEQLTGTGNITDDPMFVNPELDDYNLQSDSPCIDTGDPASPLDPDSTRADMGALYFDQSVSVKDKQNGDIPSEFLLNPPHPNPFNQSTTLEFVLPEAGQVALTLYDAAGRQVAKLLDEFATAGMHSVVFDAKDLTSGIYFARLAVGGNVVSGKMVLVK